MIYGGMIIAIVNSVGSAIELENAFQEYLKTLPEEEANKILADRKLKWEKDEEHRKKLELANAIRPRNFWGK